MVEEPCTLEKGKYLLLRRLAVGGMGEVFLARQRGAAGFERLVVIKRILPHLVDHPGQVTLFIDEARIAASLAHPNIVQVHDFGCTEGTFYMVMEYVPGQNLARIVQRATERKLPFPRDLAVHVVSEVARALEYAHDACDPEGRSLQIVHRDVSPHNVMVSRLGEVKLTDFGIARAANRLSHTGTGVLVGKLGYMAPEQLVGASVDRRVDVFATGILLWELTLLRRLFAASQGDGTLQQVWRRRIPPPTEIDPSYPPELERAVMAALEVDPERRLPTVTRLMALLREHGGAQDAAASREALGALVLELFPGQDEAGAAPGSSSASGATTASLPRTAPQRPTAAPVVVLPLPARWPTPTRNTAAGLAAAGLLLASVGILWFALRGPTRSTGDAPMADSVGRRRADGRLDRGAGRADTAPMDDRRRSADSRRRSSPPPHRPRRSMGKPHQPPQPPSVAVTGTLVVASDPWGDVVIDGRSYGQTAVQLALAPKLYRVQVSVSSGGGTFNATARVEATRKTKCRVARGTMSCDEPR